MNTPKDNNLNSLPDAKCDTCKRILQSACELFSQKSYHLVTVAEICKRAGANIAAVNYHFRGKENLYRKAWQSAFQESITRHPPDGGFGKDSPLEDQFAGHIRALITRITDPNSAEFNIMINEMTNPTGLLHEVSAQAIEPLRKYSEEIIRKLLGEKADESKVRLCHLSVVSQCIHTMMRRRIHKPLPAHKWHDDIDVEVLTQHIIDFSLAGISQMRRELEQG